MNLDLDLAPKFNVLIIVCDDFSSLSNSIATSDNTVFACFACQFCSVLQLQQQQHHPHQPKNQCVFRARIAFTLVIRNVPPYVLSIPISINEK